MSRDSLGDRMKGYESVNKNYLTSRTPTIIRLDGKAFHTFTKGFEKPFDELLMDVMQHTAKYLCENIQGCKIAYTQSDEISLLLTDYEKISTNSWFDKNIQKMVSVSASMATLAFNKKYSEVVEVLSKYQHTQEQVDLLKLYQSKLMVAMFDSRVFNLPKEEVCNYFIWRQQDATRNSIQMVGQHYFSQKQLNGQSCDIIQEMLFQEKQINWNDCPVPQKRGSCIIKQSVTKEIQIKKKTKVVDRNVWVTDKNIPIFSQSRDYIDKLL